MNNIPRVVYGNDLNIKIYVTELVSDEPVPYDLSECTDIQVQMFCSKHKTMFELPFTIDEQDSSVINAQIDYRLTHPNTMYGFVVNGYDRNEQHFQWCQKPNEGIMYVEGSSGAYLDASLDNTIDIAARIGFNLNMSNYYNKEEIDAFFENYYTIDDVNTLLNDKANVSDLNNYVTKTNEIDKYRIVIPWQYITVNNEEYVYFTFQIFNNVTNELVWQPERYSTMNEVIHTLETRYNLTVEVVSNITLEPVSISQVSSDSLYRFRYKNIYTKGIYFTVHKVINNEYIHTIDGGMIQSKYLIPYNKYSNVAYTNDYTDLSNKPDLSIYAESADLATVATTGSYDDLSNKPDFDEPQIEFVEEMPSQIDNDKIYVESPVYDFKETTINVVSDVPQTVGEDEIVIVSNPIQLKTINNQEIVGEGNIEIQGGGTQEQADWNQSDNTQVDYIKNKPDLSVYAQSSNLATVATSGSYNDLSNTPTIPAAQVQADYNQSDNTQVDYIKNKPDLSIYAQSSNLATVATSGSYSDLSNTPTIPAAQIQSDWNQTDNTQKDFIKNKPNLATVATSGSYTDLSNTPTIPAAQIQSDWNQSDNTQKDFIKNKPTIPAAQVQSNWNETNTSSKAYIQNKPNLATVATSGSYNDLNNTPTIPTVPTNVSAFTNDAGYLTSIPNTVVTSTTQGLKIEVVAALPANPTQNTIYIVQ